VLRWLVETDAGLLTRIAVGVCIFAVLGIVDWRRNGPRATRWREYGVLFITVAAACAYGAINDQITSRISWEYFYYDKELDKVLGPQVPPDAGALHWEAAKVGLKATWSAGLILGVALLLANNPRKGVPRLRNRELVARLPMMFAVAAGLGAIFGWLGYEGWLTNLSGEFQDAVKTNLFRPQRLMCTWGIHLGGYIGALVGTIMACVKVMQLRLRRTAGYSGSGAASTGERLLRRDRF
jgi:hypothetical protein